MTEWKRDSLDIEGHFLPFFSCLFSFVETIKAPTVVENGEEDEAGDDGGNSFGAGGFGGGGEGQGEEQGGLQVVLQVLWETRSLSPSRIILSSCCVVQGHASL